MSVCHAELTMGPTEGTLVCVREAGHKLNHRTADGVVFAGQDLEECQCMSPGIHECGLHPRNRYVCQNTFPSK